MTSMFDQYNKTLTREESVNHPYDNALTSSGYVSVRTKVETSIFSKQKMKLNLPKDILHLTVCNDWLVTLMSHQVLLRLYLQQPDRQDGTFATEVTHRWTANLLNLHSQRSSWRSTWPAYGFRTCSWIPPEITCWSHCRQNHRVSPLNYYICIAKATSQRKLKNSKITKSQPLPSIQTTHRKYPQEPF